MQIRGVRPRPWKTKSGEARFSSTVVLLDLSQRCCMETVEMDLDHDNEDSMKKTVASTGKQATAVVTGLKVSQFDSTPRFTGNLEATKQ